MQTYCGRLQCKLRLVRLRLDKHIPYPVAKTRRDRPLAVGMLIRMRAEVVHAVPLVPPDAHRRVRPAERLRDARRVLGRDADHLLEVAEVGADLVGRDEALVWVREVGHEPRGVLAQARVGVSEEAVEPPGDADAVLEDVDEALLDRGPAVLQECASEQRAY